MTKEMIKERIGDGLETVKGFAKDHKQDILTVAGSAAITLIYVRKLEKNAFRKGYGEALKKTAVLRDLGKRIANVAPRDGLFYVDEYTATCIGDKVDNLELVSKYLTDPEISKDITGVVIVAKG